MKTLQQIKDEVAQDNGWGDWQNIENSELEDWEIDHQHAMMLNEIAKRYARECCKATLKK